MTNTPFTTYSRDSESGLPSDKLKHLGQCAVQCSTKHYEPVDPDNLAVYVSLFVKCLDGKITGPTAETSCAPRWVFVTIFFTSVSFAAVVAGVMVQRRNQHIVLPREVIPLSKRLRLLQEEEEAS